MAAKQLLPGMGGAYTSEALTGTQTGTDTIDASRCGQLALQASSTGASGAVDLQQSFNGGTSWSVLSSSMSVANGASVLLPTSSGPFGMLRLNATVTGGTVTYTIVGYEYQIKA